MSTERNNDIEVKISVVMPVYNAGEYLCRAVEDLMHQSFSDFELICINDGSTDDSYDILEEILWDEIILLEHGENNLRQTTCIKRNIKYLHSVFAVAMGKLTLLFQTVNTWFLWK